MSSGSASTTLPAAEVSGVNFWRRFLDSPPDRQRSNQGVLHEKTFSTMGALVSSADVPCLGPDARLLLVLQRWVAGYWNARPELLPVQQLRQRNQQGRAGGGSLGLRLSAATVPCNGMDQGRR